MKKARCEITNIIERTFHVRTSFESGTAIAIEVDGDQFFVTAKHLVMSAAGGVMKGETVRLYTDTGQILLPQVVEIMVGEGVPDEGGIDVAVLKLSQRFNFQRESPTIFKPEDLFPTQRVAMPSAEHWSDFGSSFGITTRTGTIAKIVKPENRGPATAEFLVEMEAYQGFSGSPIACYDEEGQIGLAGVAVRLSWRSIQVFGPGPVHTGFIGCFHVQHAINLIKGIS